MSSWVQARRRLAAGLLRRSARRPGPGPAGWRPGAAGPAGWLAGAAGPAGWLAGAAGLAGLAVAGCAGQPDAGLPPKAQAQASAAVLTDPQLGAREQVLAAYAGYWQVTGAAVNAGGPGPARTLLARYLTPGAIVGVLAALRPDWAEHAVSAGSPVTHVLSVKITAGRALVHDCVDLSQAGLDNVRTGRPYPRSFGGAHVNYYADLVRSGSRWLVSNLVPVVAPCEP